MATPRVINFGVIGCGLMGREFASAAARWVHLSDPRTAKTLDFSPRLVAVCDLEPKLMIWFTDNFVSIKIASMDYHALLEAREIEAIYCAVPHNLHAQIYTDIIRAGKHLLGEKPFGIDRPANDYINTVITDHPNILA